MTRPPRVLHVDPGREWRGGQSQLRLLAAGLERRGVEQAVATRGDSRLAREVRALGVRVVPLRWEAGLDPRAVLGTAREAPDWEVVHAHGSHALQASLLALGLAGGAVRLVAARRQVFPLRSPSVWRRADVVVAVSRPVRDVLVAGGLEPRRVRVVHDGVDAGELRAQRPGRLRAAAGAADGELLVGTAGALVGAKDHATLLRAAARVLAVRDDVRFVVAGEGPERPALEALARELGVADRVALPGRVEEAALSLGDLDLFVMTSAAEGLGSAALEALAAGVAPVLARAGGLSDVAGAELPSVPPSDPEALAEAVLGLLADPGRRERVAAAARERAELFTAERMTEGTLDAYRAALRTLR